MNNIFLISMGSLVERRNNYNTSEVTRIIPDLCEKGIIDGAEFMFLSRYYGECAPLIKEYNSEGVKFHTFHTDKDIGAFLSDAGVAYGEGSKEEAEKLRTKAVDVFRRNCETACALGSPRLVLHLWGGLNSDSAIDYNIASLPELCEIASSMSLRIMAENVPSAVGDPLSNWHRLDGFLGEVGLVFDTRFATCHRQPAETLSDSTVTPHIEHVHVSDYRGGHKEFKCLRPVWHPGDGIADFGLIFSSLKRLSYGGSFTLESPGITGDGPDIDTEKLRRSVLFIKEHMV